MFAKLDHFPTLLRSGVLRCFVSLLSLTLIFSLLSSHFFALSNLGNILSASAVIGLLALGVTFVIGSGGIDLSIASVMALCGTLSAYVIKDSEMPAYAPILICVVTGTSCGLLTGVLVNITKAPSFIVSLGMLSVARALAYMISDGVSIYGLPSSITSLGQGKIVGISTPIIFLLVGFVLAYFILHHTVLGTHALIYGDKPSAAEVMGIRVNKLRFCLYGICGFFSGVAGFVFMARTNAGDPTAGQNYELVAITAVILGGTKLFGGEAHILGTLLGVLCLGVLQNGLNLLAVSTYYQVLFVGLVLIGAALVERLGEER